MTCEDIEKLIAADEGETVEVKETTGQRVDACETLCAFLNKKGGTVVFGVTRKGKLTGQLMSDSTKRDLFEAFQKFEPSADITVDYVSVDATHTAIVCRVDPGNCRPYVYDSKSYKRVQSSTTVMSQDECAKEGVPPPMVTEKDGYVRLTFARSMQLSQDSVQLMPKSCIERGQERGKKLSQKREKVIQNSGKGSQKSCTEKEQPRKASGQEVALKRKKVALIFDVALPALRKDARMNAEKVLLEIAMAVGRDRRAFRDEVRQD